MAKDAQNPYATITTNDAAAELTQIVVDWYRGHRNLLTTGQQSAAITAITGVLNGTFKV